MNKINIIIAEPFPVIYEGLYHILSSSKYNYSLFKSTNLNDIQHIQNGTPIDIVLMNPVLVQNNTEAFSKLKSAMDQTKWIGLVYTYFTPQLLSMFNGVIQISEPSNVIISTIQKYIVSEQLSDTSPQQFLSERELDVLKLLVTGNSNKEIADKLFISAHTVISHRKNISLKTGIKSLSGLTIYAVIQNIISIENF